MTYLPLYPNISQYIQIDLIDSPWFAMIDTPGAASLPRRRPCLEPAWRPWTSRRQRGLADFCGREWWDIWKRNGWIRLDTTLERVEKWWDYEDIKVRWVWWGLFAALIGTTGRFAVKCCVVPVWWPFQTGSFSAQQKRPTNINQLHSDAFPKILKDSWSGIGQLQLKERSELGVSINVINGESPKWMVDNCIQLKIHPKRIDDLGRFGGITISTMLGKPQSGVSINGGTPKWIVYNGTSY